MKRRGAAGEAADWFADEKHADDCLVDRWGHDKFDKWNGEGETPQVSPRQGWAAGAVPLLS